MSAECETTTEGAQHGCSVSATTVASGTPAMRKSPEAKTWGFNCRHQYGRNQLQ